MRVVKHTKRYAVQRLERDKQGNATFFTRRRYNSLKRAIRVARRGERMHDCTYRVIDTEGEETNGKVEN